MLLEIEKSGRHLVTITDPHISDDYFYFVRTEGATLEESIMLQDGTQLPGV